MGDVNEPTPVNLICGVLAGRTEWLDEARGDLEAAFGTIEMTSETWPFDFTDYYEAQMGESLLRRFYSFAELIDPGELADVKLKTNAMEADLAARLDGPERPVNLDPGYVCEGKLVLATTKDQAHRLYLGRGICAECTLGWRDGAFEPWNWTYPDYATEHYRQFFGQVRAGYMAKLTDRDEAAN